MKYKIQNIGTSSTCSDFWCTFVSTSISGYYNNIRSVFFNELIHKRNLIWPTKYTPLANDICTVTAEEFDNLYSIFIQLQNENVYESIIGIFNILR